MPQEIFEKITKDDGTTEYVPVTVDKLEIPDEVVRTTKAYKDVLEESISRRQKLKTATEQLAQLTKSEDDDKEPPQPAEESSLQFKSRDELLNFIVSEINNRDTEAARQSREKESKVEEIINKHKLSTDVKQKLMKLSLEDAEDIAQYIGQSKLQFDSTKISGGEQKVPSVDSIAERVNARLNLNDPEK